MSQEQRDDTATTEPAGKPSQAEGERSDQPDHHPETQPPAGKPSQAEGERDGSDE